MKFQFHMKNGKIHEFTLPDNVRIYRAIVWISEEDGKEMLKAIIIPDDVESVEELETETA
jgi:hypothetical protein